MSDIQEKETKTLNKMLSATQQLIFKASKSVPAQLALAIAEKLEEAGLKTLDDFELSNKVAQSAQSAIRSAADNLAASIIQGSFETVLKDAPSAFVDAYSKELDTLNEASRAGGINVSRNIIVLRGNITSALLSAAQLDASALLAAAHQKDEKKK